MRFDRSLLAVCLAFALLAAGCAGSGGGEELEEAQALAMAPGTNASMPLVITEEDFGADVNPGQVQVSAEGEGLEATVSGMSEGEGVVAGWMTVSATEETEEGRRLVEVSVEDKQRSIPITVQTPEDPLQEGEIGHLTFSARTQAGELVLTNDENVSQAPLPRSTSFQEPRSFEPITPRLVESSQLPAELLDAVVGSGVGHSQAVEVSGVFGPETIEDVHPRKQTIQRELTVPTQVDYPTRQAQQYLPRDAQPGDEIDLPHGGQTVPYLVQELTRQRVSFELALEQGERFTSHPAWPDAAEVTNLTGENATVHLTPPDEPGDHVTWIEPWGNVTQITSITEEEVTLRHSPEEGFTYEQTSPRSGEPIETEVVEVGPDEIVVSKANPHPLAGETLVFDVTIVDRQPAPPQPPRR